MLRVAGTRLAPLGAAPAGGTWLAARLMSSGVATGPGAGYSENPEEREGATTESQEQLAQDRENATKMGGKDLSEPELARALAHESREAAAEHLEDADASQVQGDTVTDREVLEGKGGTPATTSTPPTPAPESGKVGMLRAAARATQLRVRLQQASAGRAAVATSSCPCSKYEEDHVLITEQDQGHILEKLEDPAEVERMLLHMRSRSTWGDTMADTILRESLEARKADFERKQADKYNKVLCEHGHEHDVCCGAKADEVEGE